MKFGSVCSGIEAASVAWHPLGWETAWVSEIEKFPCKVLAHHYPTVENRGDMTRFKEWSDEPIELLVGGTPCQPFSVAGLRKGLDDPRGNLMLTFGAIAGRYRPKWLVWENVPGVLSSNGGRDFGSFLGMLGQLGYGFAYRVLDAQHFGVPQRRRRVFVVGHLGDWRPAAAVLFERHGLQGHPAPSRKAGEGLAAETAGSLTASGRAVERTGETRGQDPVVATYMPNTTPALRARDYKGTPQDVEEPAFVANTLLANYDASEDGTGRGTPLVPEVIPINTMVGLRHEALGKGTGLGIGKDGDPANTLSKAHSHAVAVCQQPIAFKIRGGVEIDANGKTAGKGYLGSEDKAFTVAAAQDQQLLQGMAVRRLTPRECERLQGFPDDYTLIPGAKDGPRYKALGNSMAVPVMRWIGERIQTVEKEVLL